MDRKFPPFLSRLWSSGQALRGWLKIKKLSKFCGMSSERWQIIKFLWDVDWKMANYQVFVRFRMKDGKLSSFCEMPSERWQIIKFLWDTGYRVKDDKLSSFCEIRNAKWKMANYEDFVRCLEWNRLEITSYQVQVL